MKNLIQRCSRFYRFNVKEKAILGSCLDIFKPCPKITLIIWCDCLLLGSISYIDLAALRCRVSWTSRLRFKLSYEAKFLEEIFCQWWKHYGRILQYNKNFVLAFKGTVIRDMAGSKLFCPHCLRWDKLVVCRQ